MEQRFLGRTGLAVSRLGLGTMTWGRDTDEHEARDQLTAFVEAGGTLVDTAAGYAGGASETVLGRLLGDVVDRDEVVISTKAGVRHPVGTHTRPDADTGAVDLSRRALLRDLDGSLGRLGVDHVDLWQLQAWDERYPAEEALSALDEALASGRCRYVGVSNYAAWQTAYAATFQRSWPSRADVTSTQVEYSLLHRRPETEMLPAARSLGLGFLAWSPLGRGVLTGKYRLGIPADSRAASPHLEDFVSVYLTDRARRIVDAVCKAADGLGLSPLEVALAWVRDRPGVTAAILGARTNAQLLGALTVEEINLPAEIADVLDEVSATP